MSDSEEKNKKDLKPTGGNVNPSMRSTPYQIFSAEGLLSTDFCSSDFIVPNLVQQGLTILAGKPKVGKSLLAANIAVSLMHGANALGVIETNCTGVLYLALEDTARRMKAKIETILNGYPANDCFYLAFAWSGMDGSFFSDLEAFVQEHPDTKLVIVDTYTRIRGKKRPGASLYEKDYNEAALLKDFADNHGLSIILIHHLRKSESKDVIDMISGSVGITGAADTILALTRGRREDDAILYATGRDIEEAAFGLKFNKRLLAWEISGSAAEQTLTTERLQVYEVLKNSNEPIRLAEIAAKTGKKLPVTHKHLAALIVEGLIQQPGYGLYAAVRAESSEASETGETSDVS
jgi:RecA-family ATPase